MDPEPMRWNKFRHRGVILKGEYGYFLCFQITQRFNNLITTYNPNNWSEEQQTTYHQIQLLRDEGLGYRRIAQHLNAIEVKTTRGNTWKNTQVFSFLKRYKQREKRRKIIDKKYKVIWGKMWLEFTTR